MGTAGQEQIKKVGCLWALGILVILFLLPYIQDTLSSAFFRWFNNSNAERAALEPFRNGYFFTPSDSLTTAGDGIGSRLFFHGLSCLFLLLATALLIRLLTAIPIIKQATQIPDMLRIAIWILSVVIFSGTLFSPTRMAIFNDQQGIIEIKTRKKILIDLFPVPYIYSRDTVLYHRVDSILVDTGSYKAEGTTTTNQYVWIHTDNRYVLLGSRHHFSDGLSVFSDTRTQEKRREELNRTRENMTRYLRNKLSIGTEAPENE